MIYNPDANPALRPQNQIIKMVLINVIYFLAARVRL